MDVVEVLQTRAAVCTDALTLLATLLRGGEQAAVAGKRIHEIWRQVRRRSPLESCALTRARQLRSALAAIESDRFADVPQMAADALASARSAEQVLERSLRNLFHGGKEPMLVLQLNDVYDHLRAAIGYCRRACDDLHAIATIY